LRCGALVVATGGLSIPSMGATGYGYELARQFGHSVLATRAGLVPLTLSGAPLADYEGLAGLAVPAAVEAGGMRFDGGLLFTHRGLSGPPILQVSSYWSPGEPLALDLLPGEDAAGWLLAQQKEKPNAELRTALAERLTKRLAQRLCERWLGSKPLRQYRAAELQALGARLQAWSVTPNGTEGYRTAEVTEGGVDTDGVSSSTMESRKQPGLYFLGEVLDVSGQLGGYNFQWAWASAHAAAQALSRS
jgi:predicted Rossmann fold flavoprotein